MALEQLERLKRDLRKASVTLSDEEARFLVDAYYTMQEDRKRADNQVRALGENGEPHLVLQWLADQNRMMENQIKAALDVYSASRPIGEWARGICGIGPVIAAGLMAHIDITRAPTVGHIWRYAGLDPTVRWEKGKVRPWNARLKTLCWKIGESFVKVSGRDDDIYGKVYLERKALEIQRNDDGEFADQAAKKLEDYSIGKTTEAYQWYSNGKLPPAHIHARAKRYAVKLFLSHWHEVAYREHYGEAPPAPYPIAHLGHAHKIAVPA
ncbi:transposase [Halomonas sp. NO4]|uniref:transposase n=1 Tax=Halomonas sp. NO4 TaxID=2484813 RepID=UPI0013D6FA02|nr:transposase [Halomonas sp. NO4]